MVRSRHRMVVILLVSVLGVGLPVAIDGPMAAPGSSGRVVSSRASELARPTWDDDPPSAGTGWQDGTAALVTQGYQPLHPSLDFFPWEHIDVASGNVLLSFTYVDLPGNGLLPLRVTRYFNTNKGGGAWVVGPGRIEQADALPDDTGFWETSPFPVLVSEDGSRQTLGGIEMVNGKTVTFMAADFSIYDRRDHTLKMPNGVVVNYDYTLSALGDIRFPTFATDPFGNTLQYIWEATSTYPPARIATIRQNLGSSQVREVHFNYREDATLESIQEGARTWAFARVANTDTVTLPTGVTWSFGFTGFDLTSVQTPTGAEISYVFEQRSHPCGATLGSQCLSKVLTERRVLIGNEPTPDYWIFDYPSNEPPDDPYTRTVRGPEDTWVRYTLIDPRTGAARGREVRKGGSAFQYGTTWETETLTYADIQLGAPLEPPPTPPGPLNFIPAPAPMIALVSGRTITRDGKAYGATLSYHFGASTWGDYGQPYQIQTTGDFSRTISRTFKHDFTGYIRGKLQSETITESGGGTFSTSAAYDADTGFVTSRKVYETTTTFEADDRGNLAKQIDGDGKWTEFPSYSWGRPSLVKTPLYSVKRDIQSDGTVNWEARDAETGSFSRKAYFEHDALGRETRRTPVAGHATVTDYTYEADASNPRIRTTRGTGGSAMWTETRFDAYGRVRETENNGGVETQTTYDVFGRVAFASFPFQGTAVGTAFGYDPLGRIQTKTSGGQTTEYLYNITPAGASTTTIREPFATGGQRSTVQTWAASGHPDGKRLIAVTDAEGHETSYSYDAINQLTRVVMPGVSDRTYAYFSGTTRLDTLNQPESGITKFSYYDNGKLKTKTDANNHTLTYSYDAVGRIESVVASHDSTASVAIVYDDPRSDNRTQVSNAYVITDYTYDDADRLTSRTDTIRASTTSAAHSFTTNYSVNAFDNIETITYPAVAAPGGSFRRIVTHGFDGLQRIQSVTDNENRTYASNITYHPSGQISGFVSGNGIVSSFSYDPATYRPTEIRHGEESGPALRLAYSYFDDGNVKKIQDLGHNSIALDMSSDGYDRLDRLIRADGPWGTLSYAYDDAGNRLSRGLDGWATTYYGYYAGLNRLQTVSDAPGATFIYSTAGELQTDGNASYAYTPTGMLERAELNGQAITYRYDGDDLRALKASGEVARHYYVRGPAGQLLTEFTDTGAELQWQLDYVYAGSRLLAAVRPSGSGTLTVGKAGAGTGTVTSTPAGISCGPTCGATMPTGTLVTLTATADPGWVFVGWSGDADCVDGVVTLAAPKTCVAAFAAFAKRTPASGSVGLGTSVALTWSAVASATYEVCVDTTDDRACGTSWQPAGAATTLTVGGLSSQTTYFWQVRTAGSSSQEADVGSWSSFTVDQPAPRRHWYLAEGTTVWAFGFQEDLLVFNPTAASTHVDIQYLKPNGTVVLQDFDLGAKTRRAVRVNTVVQGTDVAAVVESSTQDVVVERTMTWSSGRGGHHGAGVTAPALDWYLAEGTSYGDFATYVTIANPGTAATDVQVTFTPDTGTAVTQTYTVGAQSRLTVYANGVIGAARNFWTRVHSLGTGVVVERSMYWGSNFEGGHETAASPVRAPEWRFAEGATGPGFGFSTYLLIANPDATATAAVQVRFVKGDGTTVTQSYQVQPLKRQTILVNDVPGMGWAPGFSTVVRSVNGVGVVAERVMYWGNWVEGHATMGAPARSVAWWCGEGRQGTQDGLSYETYIPLLNEDPDQALTVRAEFALETGTTVVRTYVVQPGQRFTVWTGNVAELVGQKFAVTLEGTTADGVTPLAFVAERVTYWGDGWYGGHGSLGVARR